MFVTCVCENIFFLCGTILCESVKYIFAYVRNWCANLYQFIAFSFKDFNCRCWAPRKNLPCAGRRVRTCGVNYYAGQAGFSSHLILLDCYFPCFCCNLYHFIKDGVQANITIFQIPAQFFLYALVKNSRTWHCMNAFMQKVVFQEFLQKRFLSTYLRGYVFDIYLM